MGETIKFDIVKKYAVVNGETATIDICGSSVEVKRNISLPESVAFVSNVVELCFSETGEYMPELKDFGIRLNVIARFTNIELNDTTSNVYDVLYGNDLFETVLAEIDSGQLKSIVYGIDQRIKLVNDMNVISFNNNMDKLQKQVAEFLVMFEDLFSGVTKEDLSMIAKAIGNEDISVEKLVHNRLREKEKQDGIGD